MQLISDNKTAKSVSKQDLLKDFNSESLSTQTTKRD